LELESEELRFDSLSVGEAAIARLAFGNATLSRTTFTPAVLKARCGNCCVQLLRPQPL